MPDWLFMFPCMVLHPVRPTASQSPTQRTGKDRTMGKPTAPTATPDQRANPAREPASQRAAEYPAQRKSLKTSSSRPAPPLPTPEPRPPIPEPRSAIRDPRRVRLANSQKSCHNPSVSCANRTNASFFPVDNLTGHKPGRSAISARAA